MPNLPRHHCPLPPPNLKGKAQKSAKPATTSLPTAPTNLKGKAKKCQKCTDLPVKPATSNLLRQTCYVKPATRHVKPAKTRTNTPPCFIHLLAFQSCQSHKNPKEDQRGLTLCKSPFNNCTNPNHLWLVATNQATFGTPNACNT